MNQKTGSTRGQMMRGLLGNQIVTALVAVCALSTAQAAPVQKASNKGKTGSVTAPAIVEMPEASLAPAAVDATSTTTLSTVTKDSKAKTFVASIANEARLPKTTVQNRGGGLNTWNFVQGRYYLSDTKSVSVRQEYTSGPSSDPNNRKEFDFKAADVFVGYVDSDLVKLPADINVTGIARAYFPTSEGSQLDRNMGSALAWMILGKNFGKAELNYHLLGAYQINRQNSYVKNNKINGTFSHEIYTFVEGVYNVTPKFSVWQTAGTITDYFNTTDGMSNRRMDEKFELHTGVSYKPVQPITLKASLHNATDIWSPKGDRFSLYRSDETQYRFTLQASM